MKTLFIKYVVVSFQQDVLLFIDNIFRFTQAGSEVSALLGRIPSAVGYQPTLATDMGTMQVINLLRFYFYLSSFVSNFLVEFNCLYSRLSNSEKHG